MGKLEFIGDEEFIDEVEAKMEEAMMNCGLMPNGRCDQAGTEWCDWSCPFADEARHNRRKRKSEAMPLPLFETNK